MNEDVQFQIECLSTELVEMLMQKYGWDVRKALDELYSSETYSACVIQPVVCITKELYMFSLIWRMRWKLEW